MLDFSLLYIIGGTGALQYHYQNATFSAERVNLTLPAVLKNGRSRPPAPTPDGKLEVCTAFPEYFFTEFTLVCLCPFLFSLTLWL